MNRLIRCKIKPRIWSCQINLFSAIANDQPEDWTPWEQENACTDATFLEISKLHDVLQLCSGSRTLNQAKAAHSRSICFGLQEDITTSNILIKSYSECGLISLARQVFDKMPERSSVSWNTMMTSYTKKGMDQESLELFFQMRNERVKFNEFTLPTVLSACRANSDVFQCKQLHAFAIKTRMEANVFVSTAMLDLYAKCGFVLDAVNVFESMIERSSVTWSSMVAGYVLNRVYEGALLLFRGAQIIGQEQNPYTLSSVLCACANLAALIEGKQIHAILLRTGINSNLCVVASLIDMYSKCGSIREASAVFSDLEDKNDVVWNAMISGFAKHARSMEVMILFEKMQQTGVNPNEVTFTSLLSACGHMGLVEKGQTFFQLMETERGLTPNVVHYSCMVDIFCRAGHLSKAYELVESMPFTPTASIWGSILASCRVYGNLQLAKIAAKKLLELEPENAGNHVLLSNVYAANRKWDEVAQSRKILKESEAKKVRGKSWIEIKDKVHVFAVGDREHSRILEIYSRLDELVKVLKIFGYEPAVEHELHDVEESKKMELLRHHSEKIAFVFGLMCLPVGVPIRIMKNLRICVDCHAFMKVASRVMGREIVVRDVNRFHHFRDGSCSCGEFW